MRFAENHHPSPRFAKDDGSEAVDPHHGAAQEGARSIAPREQFSSLPKRQPIPSNRYFY